MTIRIPKFLRAALAALTCILSLLATSAVHAADARKPFDIPAGPALTALKQFTAQSGQQLLYSADAVQGLTTKAVKGAYTPREALDQMVSGTTVTVVVDKTNGALSLSGTPSPKAQGVAPAVASSDRPAQPARTEEVVQLSAFVVSTEGDRGYMATNAVSGTMTNQPIKDIPGSLSVINEEMIQDLGARTLMEVLRYAPGVFTQDPWDDRMQVRGFSLNVPLQDGFRESAYHPSEQIHVERVEILRGPAGLLYGNTFDVGGIVNRLTKQPSFKKSIAGVQFQLRDHDYYQASFDYNRPVSDKFAYRVVTNGIKALDFMDFVSLNRFFIRVGLTYKLASKTTSTTTLEYINQRTHKPANFDYWTTNNPAGILLRMPWRFNAAQNLARFDGIKYAIQETVMHSFSSDWQLRSAVYIDDYRQIREDAGIANVRSAGGRYTRADGVQPIIPAGQFWLVGTPAYFDRNVFHTFFQSDLTGRFTTGPARHQLLAGVAWTLDDDGFYRRTADFPSINVTDLSYAALSAQYGTTLVNKRFFSQTDTQTRTRSAYVTDSISFFSGRVHVVAGVRYDEFEQKSWTKPAVTVVPAVTTPAGIIPPVTAEGARPPNTVFNSRPNYIPRAGLVYKPIPDLSLYTSYSENYVPVTGANGDGTLFRPVTGQQTEVGFKSSFFRGRINLMAAAFALRQSGIRENDPTRPGFSVQLGTQTSDGWEVSLVAVPVDNFQLTTSYSHTEAKILNSAIVANVGLPLTNVPRNRANAWAKYTVKGGPLNGWGLGLGVNTVDGSRIIPLTGSRRSIPGYVVWDGALSRTLWGWKLGANVRNLFNRYYYITGNAFMFTRGYPTQYSLSAGRGF